METLLQDIRYAFRMLRKSPGFAAVAVITLALGIGANTAIFSVVNAVLIRPLPYPNANRLVMIWEKRLPDGEQENTTSPATFLSWREHANVLEQTAACFNWTKVLTGGAAPERLNVQEVSPNFFALLGVNAAMGRTLLASEDSVDGANDVVVLSFELWQRRFGSDPRIVGRNIVLNGKPQTVVGVMPRGFKFFVKHGSFGQEQPEVWLPLTFSEKDPSFHGRYIQAVGLLRPGVTLPQAQSAMTSLALSLEAQDPESMKNWTVNLVPLRTQFVGAIQPALQVLLGAVGLVLLIVCANVATLLLARSKSRSHEIAIRVALGAKPWLVIRQVLTESFLLAALGAAAGLLLARWSATALLALAPQGLIPLEGAQVDLRVLVFTAGIAVLTGLLFGVVPAVQAARARPNAELKEGGRSGSESVHSGRVRNSFVVTEIALALVLLAGSGLLIRSFGHLMAVDPGFQSKGILTARVELPSSKYKDDAKISEFYAQLLERIRQLPGVRSASADAYLPFAGGISSTGVEVEGRPPLPAAEQPEVDVAVVEPHFFETLGIPLLRGRSFTDREAREVSHTVVISQSMARKLWPNEDPVGKRVTIHMKDVDVPSQVIGVVGDVRQAGLDTEVNATAYWPHPELAYNFMTLVIRTDGDPLAQAPAVRQAVWSLDRDQPVADIRSMEDLLWVSLARARFSTVVLGVFAGMALLLAITGIYGVVSYSVAERTREIGIRVALGAQRTDVLRMVLRQGLILAGFGIAIGMTVALGATRLLTSLLFGTSASDPATFASVAGLLIAVVLAACYVPARNAMKVDPMVALRYE
ncbi:MAG TPA: ABC transporter permease [Terriglobales bacterium]|jgi:putative ABC transport system permease protein|nr:ABC transporter permease [Terriglobales bacterium]